MNQRIISRTVGLTIIVALVVLVNTPSSLGAPIEQVSIKIERRAHPLHRIESCILTHARRPTDDDEHRPRLLQIVIPFDQFVAYHRFPLLSPQ